MATELRRIPYTRGDGRQVERLLIRCSCGTEVLCATFTNTCSNCGTDYNTSGQALAPREQWGEETGEHWSDVARITGEEDLW
jgi:hypothetical protein